MFNHRRTGWIIGSIFIVIGIFLTVMSIVDYNNLRHIVCVVIGIGMILVNSLGMFMAANNFAIDGRRRLSFFGAMLCVGLGIFYIPFHNLVMSIICGSVLVIIPTCRIIFSRNKFMQFKKEIILYMIAITILFMMLDIMFLVSVIVFAAVFYVFGLYCIISPYIVKRKRKNAIDADITVSNVEPFSIEYVEIDDEDENNDSLL